MFAFFKREPEPDMIRLDTHKEIVAEIEKDAQAERETVARILQRNIELQGRVDVIEAANHGLLRDKIAESKRADILAGQLDEALKTIDDLRPDAEKHRERLRRDRESAAAKRAKAGASVRLEAAEPPADPYDTARDSRRDDREIHGL